MAINQTPRDTLTRIIAQHGLAICDQPKRVEGLLRDLCGAYRREINIISGAHGEGVAADLLRAGKSGVPREALLARLTGRLQENLAYTPEAARWAVDTWAVALGVVLETELQAREQRVRDEEQRVRNEQARSEQVREQQRQQSRINQTQSPNDTSNNANSRMPPSPTGSGSSQANRGSGQTSTPVNRATQPPPQSPPQQQTSPRTPPAQRPAYQPPAPGANPSTPLANSSPLSPPARPRHTLRTRIFPLTNVPRVPPPAAQASPRTVQTQTPQTPTRKRRGLKLVGCFVGFVLIAVLIIGAVIAVPAIIRLLQEEQARPSINEPRVNQD